MTNSMTQNVQQDAELISVFSIDESEDDSDEEYFPWSLTGRTLQEVENPYDKAVRIQQANRELFSQPVTRKKHPSRVKFDLVPKMVDGPQVDVVTAQRSQSNSFQQVKRKESYRRRMTPMTPMNAVLGPPQMLPQSPPPGDDQPGAPRLTKSLSRDMKKNS